MPLYSVYLAVCDTCGRQQQFLVKKAFSPAGGLELMGMNTEQGNRAVTTIPHLRGWSIPVVEHTPTYCPDCRPKKKG